MPGFAISTHKIAATLLLTASAVFAGADYFPLEVGNQWVYRVTGSRGGLAGGNGLITLEVARTGEFEGLRYSLLRGMPRGEYWLRMDDDGRLLFFDTAEKVEKLWYNFGAPLGETYESGAPGSLGRAMVQSRNASLNSRIGVFANALQVVYPGVFQVGVDREMFLPYIGLVRRVENTGGPTTATWDLIYARLRGSTVISTVETAFDISVDPATTRVPPEGAQTLVAIPPMQVRLSLRHTGDKPVELQFASGQEFDIAIKNDKGATVRVWSADKLFTQALHSLQVQGEKNWIAEIPIDGLAPGNYVVEGWLTTVGGITYRASIPVALRTD